MTLKIAKQIVHCTIFVITIEKGHVFSDQSESTLCLIGCLTICIVLFMYAWKVFECWLFFHLRSQLSFTQWYKYFEL